MDLEQLHATAKDAAGKTLDALLSHPAARAHRQAEAALLVAAARHQRAQAAIKERGGSLAVRNEAAAAHLLLDRAAVAYGEAHAALVAAS